MIGVQNQLVGGRYRLIEIVGRGGAGVVWRALDLELNRDVAIKLLSCPTEENKTRIWREARLAALLSMGGAVPLYDFGDDGDHCFLVMELLRTPTLRALLEQTLPEQLPYSDGIEIFRGLTKVLANAHQLNLIHRDLKPENIFVFGTTGNRLTVKLADFGLAFLYNTPRRSLGRLSDAGLVSGTPAYLSPEQARGVEIGKATDIYSLGCVAYEIFCGEAPFYGSVPEVMSKHIYVPAIPPQERVPGLPDDLSNLLETMLVKPPEERPSIQEVIDVLAPMDVQPEPWLIGREKRSPAGLSRSERMVDASSPSSNRSNRPTPLPCFVGKAPDKLSEKLANAGLQWVPKDSEANIAISHPTLSATAIAESPIPLVAWLGQERGDIPDLIRRGFSDVIRDSTHAEPMRRKLEKSLLRNMETRQF